LNDRVLANLNAVALQLMDGTGDGVTTEIAAVKPFCLA
jgi:hypothetical protein